MARSPSHWRSRDGGVISSTRAARAVCAALTLVVAVSFAPLGSCATESGTKGVLIVCDLHPLGVPAFRELETTWLYLASSLSAKGRNVTLVPVADAETDYGGNYLQNVLRAKVAGLKVASDAGKESKEMSVHLADVPVYHDFATPSRAIHNSYSLYTWLKERDGDFDAVYYTDWGGAIYYALLAKDQGLFFDDVSFVEVESIGSRLDHASLRGVLATTDLFDSLDHVQAAYMEISASARAGKRVRPSDFVLPIRFVDGHEESQPPPDERILDLVYFGSLTQADGIQVFTKALEKLCADIFQEMSEGEGRFDRLHVTFFGHRAYFNQEKPSSSRKAHGQAQVERYLNEWLKWAEREYPDKIKISAHDVSLEQQVGYFKMKPGAVAILCNTKAKQNFVLQVLEANRIDVIRPADAARENEGNPCRFRPTASDLFRELRRFSREAARGSTRRCPPSQETTNGTTSLGVKQSHRLQPDSMASDEADDFLVLRSNGDGNGTPIGAGRGVDDGTTLDRVLVTCVITHFNRGDFLLQALESIRAQTHKKIEIIIVDDGSTDPASVKVLDDIEGSQGGKCTQSALDEKSSAAADEKENLRCVRVLRVENSYLGAARNHGLRAAKGDFVLFMDDDNYAKPWEISTFLRAMARTGADVATCASEYLSSSLDPREAFNTTLLRLETPKTHIPLGPSLSTGLFTNIFGDANMMVRRGALRAEIYGNIGFWPEDDAYSVQDWEVLARETIRDPTKVQLIPEPLFYYRTTASSMAQTASTSTISRHSDQLYLRSFLRGGLPLGLGPLVPYLADLKLQVEEVKSEHKESKRRSKMLTAVLKPLVVEHCKYQKRFNADPFSKNLLLNPHFMEWNQLETYQRTGQLAKEWDRYESGYTFTRDGLKESNIASPACLVKLTNIGKVAGARQEVVLKQNEPKPMVLHGWSMAFNITGQGQPADYSLYTDIAFMDGSHAWGEYCPFDQTKSGEWQETFGVIDYDKPIHSVVVVLMLRWRQGSAIFDSVSLTNLGDGICGCNHLIQ